MKTTDYKEELEKKIDEISLEWYEANKGFCENKEKLADKIKGWINNADENEKSILLDLFKKSKYYSKSTINKVFLQFYNKLENKEYSLFTAIESQDIRQNSSHSYLNEFALISDVSEYNIIPMLSGFPKQDLKYIKNIVFLDDIVGTGQTIIDFFDTILEILDGKKIYIWVICITAEAKIKLEEYALNYKLQLEICFGNIEEKAFKEGYIFDISQASHNKLSILNLEKKLWNKDKCDYFLGKDDSQCLVSFYNDTPNNTLSSFWFFSESWNPIFERKKKKQPAWLKEKKKERRRINYEQKH